MTTKLNMKDNRKSLKYYYLRINGYEIIDFARRGLTDLEDFVRLNLFTSNFESVNDLIDFLKKEGYLNSDIVVEDIDIVKQVIKKDGMTYFRYYHITDRPLLKDDQKYFSERVVRDFIRFNMDNYGAIWFIVDCQKRILSAYFDKFKYNSSKRKLVDNLNVRLSNMRRIQVIIEELKNGDKSRYEEYEKRLVSFVDSEILYMKNTTATTNYRGLLEMAKTLSETAKTYDGLKVPKDKEEKNYDLSTKINYKGIDMEDEVDPDGYMFLEKEDYENMLAEGSKKEFIESIEDQVENLEEKKAKF